MANLLGKSAPSISADAVVNGKITKGFSLAPFLGKKKVFLFFYPLDFTFVCPTELHAFEEMREAFEQRETQLVACSVDSIYSHDAWLKTPKAKGGIEGIHYPVVSDLKKEIAQAYGVLKEEEGIAYRGQFLIDKKGIVRHVLINDLPIGRSVEEALRLIDALDFTEKHGEVCPANWHQGKQAMQPSQEGVQDFFKATL